MSIEIDHLSYSAINRFLKCPVSWYHHYVRGISTPLPSWLYLGQKVHKALEFHYKEKMKGTAPSIDRTTEFFAEVFGDGGGPDVAWRNFDPSETLDLGTLMIYQYLTNEGADIEPVVVEMEWSREIEGVNIVGRTDLIDSRGVVIDWKTVSKPARAGRENEDLQPTVTALGMGGGIDFEFHYIVKTVPPSCDIRRTSRSQRDIDRLYNSVIVPMIRAIKAEVFMPTAGWACSPKYCEFWDICEHRKSV